ncbi:MAG: MATE family efflux transporter [bacterium]|nr:MATE family efflux transporter [bacterium]
MRGKIAATARQEKNQITEGVIWKQLLIFFFPILLGTFFQQLYNTADAIIVGKFVGKQALASVGGTSNTIINLFVGFFVGLSSGATVIISQFFGGQDDEGVSHAVHTSIALSLVGGVLIMVVGILVAPWALRLLGTPDDVFDGSLTYMRVYFCGIIASLLYNIGTGILRAIGDSRRPLYFLMVACFVNIILDILLVLGCQLGVLGVALGTVISQCVSAVLVIVTLLRSDNACKLIPKQIRLDIKILQRILVIGFPAGLQSVMYTISNMIIQAGVNSFGTDTMAAWTAYGKIDSLFWMIINAFGIAITTFVGQNYGAKMYERMKKSVRVCLAMSFGTTIFISIVLVLGGQYIFELFTNDAEVLRIGMEILRFTVPTFVCYVCIEILSGAARGTGDTLIPTLITAIGVCLLRAIWVLGVVPRHHTILMVVFSYPLTWVISSTAFILYYLHIKKKWH